MNIIKRIINGAKHELCVYVASDKGNSYEINEDQYYIDFIEIRTEENVCFQKKTTPNKRAVFAVCDGMGGESHGDIAAKIAVSTLGEYAKAIKKAHGEELASVIKEYVFEVNKKILNLAKEKHCRYSGSTLAMVCVDSENMHAFSLGDSRIYLFRNNEILQISEDQTVANRKLKANIYTEEEAKNSADAHKLTSFLGSDDRNIGLPIQSAKEQIFKDDIVLICSDGLTDLCSNKEIADILTSNPQNPAEVLLKTALRFEETDNITCVVIKIL